MGYENEAQPAFRGERGEQAAHKLTGARVELGDRPVSYTHLDVYKRQIYGVQGDIGGQQGRHGAHPTGMRDGKLIGMLGNINRWLSDLPDYTDADEYLVLSLIHIL